MFILNIDFHAIKEQLDTDYIISIMDNLSIPFVQQNYKYVIFYSACHHPNDYLEHKPKLYYYIDTKSFYCFSCGWSGDIFALVQKIKNISLQKAVKYICQLCHIEIVSQTDDLSIDNWQGMKRYLPGKNVLEPVKIYNKNVLQLFKPYIHQSWLDDKISKETIDKYQIMWYNKNEQIIIPVFDVDGNLVGIHGRNTKKWLVDKGLKYQPVKTLNEEYKFPTGQILYGLYQNQSDIEKTKEVTIFEAPKSVLQADGILEQNNTVALFGWNMQPMRRDILIKYNIQSVNIALDKQYQSIDDAEFQIYRAHVNKIVRLFKPYCDVYVIWDSENMLDYKDSPTDKGKNVWNKLYNNRTLVK